MSKDRGAPMWWSVFIRADRDPSDKTNSSVTTEQLEDLLERLGDNHATIGGGQDHVEVQMSIEGSSLSDICDPALTTFAEARDAVGLPPWPIVRFEALTEEELDAELATPTFPDVVGVSEAAELLGVSRQRLSQLASRQDFPPPMVQLAAGPVWLTSSIQAFAQSWSRQPGRPPKTAGRVKARGASRDEVRAAAKRAERRAAAKTGMTRPAPEVLEGPHCRHPALLTLLEGAR